MIARSLGALRRLRLRALMARELANAGDVWDAYCAGEIPPPLRFRNGQTLHHGPDDAPVFLFFEIYANGCYRRSAPIPSSGVVVDIGANIGAFVLDCAARRSQVRIDAYEPNPRAFATLQQNVEANGLTGRVRLFQEAVGGRAGTLRLAVGGPSLAASGYGASCDESSSHVDAPAVTLRTIVERAGAIALLKIDAEGAEADILSSPRDLESVAAVVGEYHEDLVPGIRARVLAALREAGFNPTTTDGGRCGPMFYAVRS